MKKPVVLVIVVLMMASMGTSFLTNQASSTDTSTTLVPWITGSGSWPMFRGNLEHDGNSTSPGPESFHELFPNFNIGPNTYSSPTIANGTLCIGGENGDVRAYNSTTGQWMWTRSLGGGIYGVCSPPTFWNGHFYVYLDGNDDIYCLDGGDGSISWQFSPPTGGGSGGSSSPAISNGRLYVGISGATGRVYCINATTGTEIWRFTQEDSNIGGWTHGFYSTAAILGGRVYIGCVDGNLYCINETQPTGIASKVWKFSTPRPVMSSPAIVNNRIYFGNGHYSSTGGGIYCIDMNGNHVWSKGVNEPVLSSAAVAYGKIFLCNEGGRFYCYSASTGQELWNYTDSDNDAWGSPLVAGGKVYTSLDMTFNCFDIDGAADGIQGAAVGNGADRIWSHNFGSASLMSPAIANGVVYTGTYSGQMYAFDIVDTVPPQVISTDPSDSAINVTISAVITATFDDDMKASTLNTGTFLVENSTQVPVTGTVAYNPALKTASFTPSSPLQQSETYTVTLLGTITDFFDNGLDGNANGIAQGSPTDDYIWSFSTAQNQPPFFLTPQVSPLIGVITDYFEYSVIYTDPENTSLSGSGYVQLFIDSNPTGIDMTVNISAPSFLRDANFSNGEQFIHTTALPTSGAHTFRFEAFDEVNLISTAVLDGPTISNIPPFFDGPFPDEYCLEDVELVLDLASEVNDLDNLMGELTLATNSSYATVDGMNITFLYDNDFTYNQSRTYEIVQVTLSDPFDQVHQDLRVNVLPVNDAPRLSNIADQALTEDEPASLDLTSYISDIDDPELMLTLEEDSDHVTVEGHRLVFLYPQGVTDEEVDVTLRDPQGASDSKLISVTVSPVPDTPVIDPIPIQYCTEDEPHQLDLSAYISDVDTPVGDLVIVEDSDYTTLVGTTLDFLYPNGILSDNITLTVFDGDTYAVAYIEVIVTPVNDPPVLSNPWINVLVGHDDTTFKFRVTYTDIDGGESPVVEIVINGTANGMIKGVGWFINGVIFSYSGSFPEGTYSYYFKCTDNDPTDPLGDSTDEFSFSVDNEEEVVEAPDYVPEDNVELDDEIKEELGIDDDTDDGEGGGGAGDPGGSGGDGENPGDGTVDDDVGPGNGTISSDPSDEGDSSLWLIILIIIVIVTLIAVFLIMRKRRSGQVDEVPIEAYQSIAPPAAYGVYSAPPVAGEFSSPSVGPPPPAAYYEADAPPMAGDVTYTAYGTPPPAAMEAPQPLSEETFYLPADESKMLPPGEFGTTAPDVSQVPPTDTITQDQVTTPPLAPPPLATTTPPLTPPPTQPLPQPPAQPPAQPAAPLQTTTLTAAQTVTPPQSQPPPQRMTRYVTAPQSATQTAYAPPQQPPPVAPPPQVTQPQYGQTPPPAVMQQPIPPPQAPPPRMNSQPPPGTPQVDPQYNQ